MSVCCGKEERRNGILGRCPDTEVIDHRPEYGFQLHCPESGIWRMPCIHGLEIDF